MFKFKLSFSSFRLCRRRKSKSPATAHFFSPFNPKALEITYPVTPSPPPTTPTYLPSPLATTPVKNSGDRKKITNRSGGSPLAATPELHDSLVKNSGVRKKITNKNGGGDSLKRGSFGDSLSGGGGGVNSNVMKETLTVVKWSERPYDDFKGSMLEMILEKEMFEVKDLEELLQCFLSMNSRHHHANIVAAFTEIWELLFL